MGIRFLCPNGHKLNVKAYLAGERGICPQCDAKFLVPSESGGQVPAIDVSTTDEQVAASEPAAAGSAPVPQPVASPEQGPPAPPPAPSAPAATAAPTVPPPEAWYVRTAAGEQYGPANEEVMRGWVAEGRVTVDCWVWRTGWPDWKAGGQALTLLNGPTPVPTSPQPATPVVELPTSPASDQLPETTSPTSTYLSNKRNRQERARKVTLLLGVVVLLLFAVLIGVLIKNN